MLIHPPFTLSSTENLFLKPMFIFSDDEIEISSFSWKKALFSKYRIIHIHWIEHLVASPGLLKSISKAFFALMLLLRVKLLGIIIINTRHNLHPHARINNLFSRIMYSLWNRCVQYFVVMNRFEYTTSSLNTFHIPHHIYRDDLEESISNYLINNYADEYFVHLGRMDPGRKILELISNFGGAIQDAQLILVGEVPDKDYLSKIMYEAKKFKNIYVKPEKVTAREFDALIVNSAGVIGPLNDYHNSGVIFHVLSHKRSLLTLNNMSSREIKSEFSGALIYLDDHPTDISALLNFVSECRNRVSYTGDMMFSQDRQPHTFFRNHVNVYKTTLKAYKSRPTVKNESEPNI